MAPALASQGYRVLLYGMCAIVPVSSLTPPNRPQIFTAAAIRMPRKLPMTLLYMQHNLPSSCNMSNGPKLMSPASRWSALSPYAIVTIVDVDWFEPFIQGGGILAAFTSFFPDLVDSKVMLIAPTGLVEVLSSVISAASFYLMPASSLKTCQKRLNSCLRLSFNL